MTSGTVALMARRRWLSVVAWLALSAVVGVAAATIPWSRVLVVMRQAAWHWVLVAVALNAAILPLWAAEWRLLVPKAARVSYRTMFEVVSVSAAVLNTVPFFAGEASAVALLMTRAGLSAGAATSVLALDQLLVGMGKLAVVCGAATASPLPNWIRAGILMLVASVSVLAVALVLTAHRWPDALGRHLDALRSARRVWRAIALSLAKKAVELGGVVAVQIALGLQPSLPGGLLVVAALALSTLLPVTPANLGVYEATVFAVYRYLGVASDTALALAMIQHVCFLLPSIAIGYLTLSARQLPSRSPAS